MEILKEGWLIKKGDIIKNWKKRYFLLYSNRIEYHGQKPEKKKTAKGVILISKFSQVDIEIQAKTKQGFQFEVVADPETKRGSREHRAFCLVADTEQDRDDWVLAIQTVIMAPTSDSTGRTLTQHELTQTVRKSLNRQSILKAKSGGLVADSSSPLPASPLGALAKAEASQSELQVGATLPASASTEATTQPPQHSDAHKQPAAKPVATRAQPPLLSDDILTSHEALQKALWGDSSFLQQGEWQDLLAAPLDVPALTNRQRRSSVATSGKVFAGFMDEVLRNPDVDTTVTCFVSSTFTDTKLERDLLISDVYPYLGQLATRHGLQFIPSEMRWGIREASTNAHATSDICMTELARCQRESLGINYVVILGDKYGFRPFPPHIVEPLYLALLQLVTAEEAELMRQWFTKDENTHPDMMRLKPLTTKDLSAAWWGAGGKEGDFFKIQRALRQAANKLDGDPRAEAFTISVTHDEVLHGLLSHDEDTRERKTFFFDRSLSGPAETNSTLPALHPRLFYDLNMDGTLDTEAQDMLRALKKQVHAGLPATNVDTTHLEGDVLDPRRADHLNYLREFCLKFCEVLSDSIIRSAIKSRGRIKDELFSEVVSHNVICRQKALTFQGQEELMAAIARYVASDSDGMCVVYGGSGCGKSSAMAKAAYAAFEKLLKGNHKYYGTDECPAPAIIIRFLGTSVGSFGVFELLRSLCGQLGRLFLENLFELPAEEREPATDFQKLLGQFLQRLAWASKAKPIVLFLDSLDQLSDANRGRALRWLPSRLPPHVRMVVSTLPEEGGCLQALRDADHAAGGLAVFLEVPKLSMVDSMAILDHWLTEDKRDLLGEQREVVKTGFAQCPLPLYLRVAYDIAAKWTSTHVAEPLPGTVRGLIEVTFVTLERTHGAILVDRALSAMTAAVHGLGSGEIQDLLSLDDELLDDVFEWWKPPIRRIPPLLWTRLRTDLGAYVIERGDMGMSVHAWYHRQFWELAEVRYLRTPEIAKRCHSALADLFSGLCVSGKAIHGAGTRTDRKLTPLMDSLTDLFENMWTAPVAGSTRTFTASAPGFQQPDQVPALRKHALASMLHHFVLAGRYAEAKQRVVKLDFLASYLEAHSASALLAEIERILSHERDGDIQLIAAAMKLSGSKLTVHPSQLYEQLFLRLATVSADSPALAGLLNQDEWVRMGWEASLRKESTGMPLLFPDYPWNPETPQAGSFLALKQEYTARFDCVALLQVPGQPLKIAAGSDDKSVVVYDASNGDLVGQLLGQHNSSVSALATHPNGRVLASADCDGVIAVYEVGTSKLLYSVRAHGGAEVRAMVFLPDGLLVSGGADGTVCIWKDGVLLTQLTGPLGEVSSLDVLQDGEDVSLLAGSTDGTVRVWSTADWTSSRVLGEPHADPVPTLKPGDRVWCDTGILVIYQRRWCNATVLSMDLEKRLCTVRDDQTPDATTLPFRRVKPHNNMPKEVSSVAVGTVLHEGLPVRAVAVGFLVGSVELWDFQTGAVLRAMDHPGHHDLRCVGISADGKTVVGGGAQKVLSVWDAQTGKLLNNMEGHTSYLQGLRMFIDQDTQFVASVSLDRILIVWDLQQCIDYQAPVIGHESYVYDMAYSAQAKRSATICMAGSVVVWDEKGNFLNRFVKPDCYSIVLSDDGAQFCIGNVKTGWLGVYKYDEQTPTVEFAHEGEVQNLHAANGLLVVAGGSLEASVFNWTGQLLYKAVLPAGIAGQPRFPTIGGDKLVMFAEDGSSHVYEAGSGKFIRSMKNKVVIVPNSNVRGTISPDGKMIFTLQCAKTDQTNGIIHDVATGELIHETPGRFFTHSLYRPTFTADSKHVMIGGSDEKMSYWSVETGLMMLHMAAPSHSVILVSDPSGWMCVVGGKEVTGFKPWIPLQ